MSVFIQGGYVESIDAQYWCILCERWFTSEKAILSHCRATLQHKWCERCTRVFVSGEALEQHLDDSAAHHLCLECEDDESYGPDFESVSDLWAHYQAEHFWCQHCYIFFSSAVALAKHNGSDHFRCMDCYKTFDTEHSLLQHKKVHEPRTIACEICDRTFSRYSHLLLHLERSSCLASRRVESLAFRCAWCNSYVDYDDDDFPFFCPECETEFSSVSGLFQHVEDRASCKYLLKSNQCLGRLKAFLNEHIR